MVGRGARGGSRGRGRKRKGRGKITVQNNISTIPNICDEKKETIPLIGRDSKPILVQINRTKQINKILKSINISNKPSNLSNPQDHSVTEIIPAVGYSFRPRGRPSSTPKTLSKNTNSVMKNTDSSNHGATKIFDIEKKPEKAPSVKSDISNRSYLSEMIPFSFINVPDKRYDDYIPLNMSQIVCEGSIDSSDDDISNSGDDQRIQTGVDLVKSPSRVVTQSVASSPHGSAFDEYEFTTEEEDRLLQDSEEEDFADVETTSETSGPKSNQQIMNSSPFNEPSVKEVFKSKDIILRSDNNITIRAFTSDIFKQNINEVTTPKYNLSTQPKLQHRPIRKKFKWDYQPDNPVKLFSQDTGYESENSNDSIKDCDERVCSPAEQSNSCYKMIPNNSDANSTCSSEWANSKSIRSLKVTCTDQRRTFESVTIPPEDNSFKVPTLPPVKRPPSRPKKSDTSSTGSSDSSTRVMASINNKHGGGDHYRKSSTNTILSSSTRWTGSQKRTVTDSSDKRLRISVPAEPSNVIHDDDSISIIASSLGGDHDVGNLNDLKGLSDTGIKTESEDFGNESLLGEKRPFIENWVEDVNSAAPTEWNMPTSTDSVGFRPEQRQADIQKKDNNMAQPNNKKNNNATRVDFKSVPHLLMGVCYFKYIKGICFKKTACRREHEINKDKYLRQFQKAPPEQLVAAYQFLKNLAQSGNYAFYRDIYPVFLLAFGHHKLVNELISCIQDLFMLQSCLDVAEGIEFVVKGLECSGLTFLEAVEKISYNVGFMQYPGLADYLLQLMSRKSHLKNNWDVMKRLIKARGHISPDLASNILLKATNPSMYPPDKSLCKDMYTVIVEQKMTDVSQLEPKCLIPIRTLVTTSMSKATPAPSEVAGNSQVISTSPRENLQEHINAKLHWQREVFERRSYSPEKPNQVAERPAIFNTPPPAPVPLFNSPVRVNNSPVRGIHNSSSRSPSSCSNHSLESNRSTYFENTNSTRSHYVPKVMPRPAVPDELTLTPVHPIVGKAKYRPDYQMDISLHNLLPDSLCHVDMNESDVEKLNDAIRYADADVFLRLLEQHKSKESVKKFITMAVAHLRNFASSCSTMYKTFMDLINAIIEINPDFATIPYNKGILEVIVFNLLHTIAKKGQWKNAANMVAKFCDWDSLVSSQVFPYTITHMGRYIYLARILVNGENFQYAYEILQCPTLCLLESPEKWPYPCHAERDLEFRNKVLTDFFENGYHHNFHVVLDMYRKIFLYSGVFEFDAENSFKTMMINLIEKGKITELNYLIEDIHKLSEHMDDYVFRSYTAVMSTHLPLTISTRLYEMCCERRIHPSFQGTETVITLYCNTMDEEIYLILLAYFRKAMTSSLPPADVTIKVAIPNSYPPHPENIKLVRCVKDINIVIRNILKDKFNIVVKDEHPDCAAWILVKANQIMGYRLNLG